MIGRAPPLARRAPRVMGEPRVGPPHSFGFLRRAAFDRNGFQAFEAPDGKIILLPPNADLEDAQGE